jgi:hypothetical protein
MGKALLCAVGLLLAGCFEGVVRDAVQAQSEELVRRAAFDLSCSAENVHVKCLNESKEVHEDYGVTLCLTACVAGCGHRATYVLNNGHWVMNNSDHDVK